VACVDGDGWGDGVDCGPTDPSAFAVPGEITGLRIGTDGVTLSWDSAAPGSGAGALHDVLRGALHELPVGAEVSEECLAQDIAAVETEDTETPAAGLGFFYLVRGHTSCGVGTYGHQSNGTERSSGSCP
jgi:hypothetical protein